MACRESQGVFGVRFSSGQSHDPRGAASFGKMATLGAAVFGRGPRSRRQQRSFGGQQRAVSIRSASAAEMKGHASRDLAESQTWGQGFGTLGVWTPPILIVRWKEMSQGGFMMIHSPGRGKGKGKGDGYKGACSSAGLRAVICATGVSHQRPVIGTRASASESCLRGGGNWPS